MLRGRAGLASPGPRTADVPASPSPQMQPPARTPGEIAPPGPVFVLVRGSGSGRIRTPGWLPTSRFQVAGEPCAGVCPRLPTCGITGDPSGSVWGTQQSVATWLLHTDAQVVSPAALSRTAHTVARLVVAGGPARTPLDRLATGPGAALAEPV